jgi:hypothetical protein
VRPLVSKRAQGRSLVSEGRGALLEMPRRNNTVRFMNISFAFRLKRCSFDENFIFILVSNDLRFTHVRNQGRLINISSFCISFETMFVLPPFDFRLAHSFQRAKQTFQIRLNIVQVLNDLQTIFRFVSFRLKRVWNENNLEMLPKGSRIGYC